MENKQDLRIIIESCLPKIVNKISNNIVIEKKDISESAAKVLEHLSKIEM